MLHLDLYSPDTELIMIMFMLINWARTRTGSVVLDKKQICLMLIEFSEFNE